MLACRFISQQARAHYISAGDHPSDDLIWSWVDEARDRISIAATRRQVPQREFAATLIGVLISETEAIVFHVGDGAAVFEVDDEWLVPSWPDSGEYASTTYFITDDPAPKLRITRLSKSVSSVVAFTDGMERLALDFAQQKAHRPFCEGIMSPVSNSKILGRDTTLSETLFKYLNSDAINERTDDDKTLVLASRK